jgi:hypothetical protein
MAERHLIIGSTEQQLADAENPASIADLPQPILIATIILARLGD